MRRLKWITALLWMLMGITAMSRVGAETGKTVLPTPVATPTPTTVPFLHPPFARMRRVTSHFDHHFPEYTWDDTIVIFNGQRANAIDGISGRTATFRGGYWRPESLRYLFYDGHNGYDYSTGRGMTVLAAAPGEVVFAGSAPSGCATPLKYVCIEHENGYRTFYLHLDGICVRKGELVEAGDPVGISGNTGCSLAPHLHFAVEHNGKYTDPYGWLVDDEPDPLLIYSGEQATWLWVPDEPPLPLGRLTHPPRKTVANGGLYMLFLPQDDSPPISRVDFMAYYDGEWHHLGSDDDGTDDWSFTWDTRQVREGRVWLHAWAVGEDGRVGKGSPIRTDIILDRHPPQGFIVGLLPGSVAGGRLWLYAASYDRTSWTERVTFLVRKAGEEKWREIGDARWMHTSNWVLEWTPDVPDGTRLDIVARLTDAAGNESLTREVKEIVIDRSMPLGRLVAPKNGTAFRSALDLTFVPAEGSTPPGQVAFYVWHDAGWHPVGRDTNGNDGWSARWNPSSVTDQSRIRVQARVYDSRGRVNTALPQVTALTLDRTPPRGGYLRPRSGGVARPGVDYLAWARDDGSGVAVVEFYVNRGEGWLKIGQDNYGQDGWSTWWDARGFEDGIVSYSARVIDRAGNEQWTADVRNVALDRTPPQGEIAFPPPDMHLSGTVTLTLAVTDTVSGLDRAIFYARYGGRWHHLGADVEPEDGFSLGWDTEMVGVQGVVVLTAWVYDRAGNHVELPHRAVFVGGNLPTPTPDPSPTRSPSPSPTPSSSPSPTPSPSPSPSPTPSPSPSLTPSLTTWSTLVPSATFSPVPALSSPPTPLPSLTAAPPLPAPSHALSALPPAYWLLLGTGATAALWLLKRTKR